MKASEANGSQDRPSPAFAQRVLVVLALTGLAVLIAVVLYRGQRVFLLTFVSLLLAVLLRSAAQALSRHTSLPYRATLPFTIVIIVGLLAGASLLIGPQLNDQLGGLVAQLPDSVNHLRAQLEQSAWGHWLLERLPPLGSFEPTPTTPTPENPLMSGLASRLSGVLRGFASGLGELFYVVFVGIFFAAAADTYTGGLRQLVPARARARADEVLEHLDKTLQSWLLGQLLAMVSVAALAGTGLLLLKVPFALGLIFLTFLFEFIPAVGPWLAGVPAVLIALSQSPTLALWVVILYVVVETIEGNVLLPVIHQRTVDLPPALSLFAIFLLGTLFGLLGIIVAAPLAAVVMVLVKILYVRDTLGDEVALPGDHAKRVEPAN